MIPRVLQGEPLLNLCEKIYICLTMEKLTELASNLFQGSSYRELNFKCLPKSRNQVNTVGIDVVFIKTICNVMCQIKIANFLNITLF